MRKHVKLTVSRIPECDFCDAPAKYDGKTKYGPWANMCGTCFVRHGIGLGLGRGQELVLAVAGIDRPR